MGPAFPALTAKKTLKAIYEAATDLIYQNGYEAVVVAPIGERGGHSGGFLFTTISPRKQDLLYKLTSTIMVDLNRALDAEMRGVEDPAEQLRTFCPAFISPIMRRARSRSFIGNFELRSLQGENYRQIVVLRDQYEGRLVLDSGTRGCGRVLGCG